ncbi:segregation/condensation protein A [Streptomyces fradiae]|uniref:segregation/condensation protein A n=1 Tax=Streptomyces fradiae TaxID=1906 RepID=UPI0039865180
MRPNRPRRRPLGSGPAAPPPAGSGPPPAAAPATPDTGASGAAPDAGTPGAAQEPAAGPEAPVGAPQEPGEPEAPAGPDGVAGADPDTPAPTDLGANRDPDTPTAGAAPTGGDAPEGSDAPTGGEGDRGGRFTVRLANFEGPFDLLLQLIAKHKLDVTEVALSRVTDEFMAHIRAMGPDWDLDQATEFLVVAATLLDLKAARLLPAAEVEDEADLALLEARDLLFARLLQYRAYKRVAAIFAERLADEALRHPRTVGLEPHHAELLPDVVFSIGPEGFAALAARAVRPRPEPQVYVDHIHAPLVSVREQAAIVVARLRERGEARFAELAEGADDTLTVVARFLALLELYRDRAVALDQDVPLGELTVRWTGGEAEAAVTDEFDRAAQGREGERT